MERTKTELTLEELIPQLEAEHEDVPERQAEVRAVIWNLIDAAERYLLARHDQRTKKEG